MATYTKAELSASNAASFPDNTSGFITPALLRNFNTSSIDSYAILSGSNTFIGNQVITGSVTATSFTGSLLGTASLTLTASTVALTSDNGNQNHKVLFSNSTGSNETLLYDPNDFEYNPQQNLLTVTASYANFAISASYASASTSASYALVAQSANTIGSTTVSGIQTYTYSQNGNFKQTHKFVTGSFNIVSGSWTKIMTINSTSSSWRAVGTILGSAFATNEQGINAWGVALRQGNTTIFGQQTGQNGSVLSATFGGACPEFSGSTSGSTGVDIFARNAYNATSSLLIDCIFNYPSGTFTYTFY